MRRHVLVLGSMLVMLLVAIALALAKPFFYKEAVDIIVERGVGESGALWRAVVMMLGGAVIGMVNLTLREVSALLTGWVELRVMRDVHADVFAHVQRLSIHFHVNTFAGATARKIGRGTDAFEDMLDRLWFNFLPLLFLTVGLAIVLAFFAPIIGIAMVIGIAVFIAVSVSFSLVLSRYHGWADRQDTRVTASLVDAITGNTVVKAFGAEEREDFRHGGAFAELQRRLWKTWKFGTFVTWLQYLMITAIELVLLLLGVWLWFRGDFTAGSFIVIVSYVGVLWGNLFDIGQNVRNYLRSVAHAEEMVGLMLTPLGVSDLPSAKPLAVTRGEIRFEDITFSYPEQREETIFKDFSLTIAPGEKVALVGHSGGGKSTFVKLLLRLYDVQEGRIMIDGQDIARVTQESLRRSVALVPQDPILFHRTLRENIAYARPDASDTEIERAAKLAHVHEFIRTLPRGYDTLAGERGVKLSGGERQRVAIARAILANTLILILDEATSSLDSVSEKFIQEALASLMEGRTTIAIAHRLSTIKRVDRILVIEDGRIVEEGSHSSLLKKKDGLYRHFFELQAGGFIGE